MLQYLCLKEDGKAEAKTEKQSASPESSQINAIGMWKKKHRFTNPSLRIQKGSKKCLLKILKGHRNLQESVLKENGNNLNNFESNSEPLKDSFKSFKDTSEGEIESRAFNENLNGNQLEAEWA